MLHHLFLTGYRGCGKTTIGKLIAKKLQLDFIDTDCAIEEKAGLVIAQIFERFGENHFRDLETQQIEGLASVLRPTVVSLGGGAIVRESNRRTLRSLGCTVWLQASPEILCDRISKDINTAARRPKLSQLGDLEEIRKVLSLRSKWYGEVADLTLSTDNQTVEWTADAVARWYREKHPSFEIDNGPI